MQRQHSQLAAVTPSFIPYEMPEAGADDQKQPAHI